MPAIQTSHRLDLDLQDFIPPPGGISLSAVQADNASALIHFLRPHGRGKLNKLYMHPQILYNIDTMDKDRLRNATISLSVRLVQLYDQIERRAFLKNQLARAGTSIGANLFEARYAESPDDFVHKLRIALKECHECEYWLVVLATSCPDLAAEAESLRRDAGSIRRMLISSINTRLSTMKEK